MKNVKSAVDILRRPVISESSMDMLADQKYTFIVDKNATKIDIKNAVEEVFGVKVEKVTTCITHGKIKRMGRFAGKRSDLKKAFVKLASGSKPIEFFEGLI